MSKKVAIMNPLHHHDGVTMRDYKLLSTTSDGIGRDKHFLSKHLGNGANISLPIEILDFPPDTVSLVIIMEKLDPPKPGFCHWVVWNIPATHHLPEGDARGITGMNDFGHTRYDGPRQSSAVESYYIKIYALDCNLDIPPYSGKSEVEKAMAGHVTGFGILSGATRATTTVRS